MVAARHQIGPHCPRHLNFPLHVHVGAVARHAQNFCRHPCRKDFRRLEYQKSQDGAINFFCQNAPFVFSFTTKPPPTLHCFSIHTSPYASRCQVVKTRYLKYSLVANRSPFSSKTENRIPFGCVLRTWSHLQSMSRSISYEMRCIPPSKSVLFVWIAA